MKWIYRFFVFLGIVFFVLLLVLGYVVIVDPFNLKPLFLHTDESNNLVAPNDTQSIASSTMTTATSTESAGRQIINESQAQALESVGINPNSVPAEFTPEQTACFVKVLGQERVAAIVAGAVPSLPEFYQVKHCL